MALTLADNNELLMDGTEQDLFVKQTTLQQYETHIFFDQLAAGDEIQIRVYIDDKFDNAERRYITVPVEGLQNNPAFVVNWLASSTYRVSLQQISGTFRTISWERWIV